MNPARYNVTWHTPSEDASGSMPLGNGDIGLNAWVEASGDLCFYIGKTDSWGDNSRLLKVGRIRITVDPAPEAASFMQTLQLEDATFVAQIGYAQTDVSTVYRLWVDANAPVINLAIESTHPCTATATIELWRTEPFTLPAIETSDIMLDRAQPNNQHAPTIVEPDTLLTGLASQVGWYHHNVKSVGPALTAEQQGLTEFKRSDPLLHRTFGALVTCKGGIRVDEHRLQSPTATSHHFQIPVLTLHPSTPAQWLEAIQQSLADYQQQTNDERRYAHEAWWQAFWARSWIHVSAAGAQAEDAAFVSQMYALQRFITACSGRGAYPIQFNGSLFTVPYPDKPGDADYRRWGSGYWWQNTRLPYYALCAAGDYEMLRPLFQMHARDHFDLLRYRTQQYFGFDGIYFSECVYFWGDVFTESYGWTPHAEREEPLQESPYHKWEWVGGPELVWLMLDYYDHTGDVPFLQETVLPYAEQILRFFANFYQIDDAGKLVMHPSQSLETWWECTNPMPEVAGLEAITERLLALPHTITTVAARQQWQTFQSKIPTLPTHEVDGQTTLAPADSFANKRNVENPELYAVFPFRRIAFNRPHVEWGVSALEHRDPRGHYGWRQDDLFMSYLGLAAATRDTLVQRARLHNFDALSLAAPERAMPNHMRFPAFWGPNYDWVPDQCHGGVFATTLQTMLLQTDGDQIFLFPAWPQDWDVEFRLHAPGQTVIEGHYVNGKLVQLQVNPPKREDAIHIVNGASN